MKLYMKDAVARVSSFLKWVSSRLAGLLLECLLIKCHLYICNTYTLASMYGGTETETETRLWMYMNPAL